jgi:MFS family permease
MRAMSFAGDLAAVTAVILYLHDNGYVSGFIVATLIATAGPAVLLAPLAGRVSDRYDSRTILVVVASAQALLCVVMALWLNPYVVVGVTALLSGGLAFTHPIFGGLPRSMVGPENVVRAASISQTSAMAGMFAAPALGGFLAGTLGTASALLFNGASFALVVVGALLIRTRLHAARGRSASGPDAPGPVERYSVWRDPFIRTLLGAVGLIVTCVSINNVISVYLVRETLGASQEVFGVVGSAWMVGLIIGSIVVGRNKLISASAQILMAFLFMGIALVLTSLVPSVWWLLLVNVLGGIGNGTMATNLHVIFNLAVPDNHRGRGFAALGAVSNAAPMSGYFLGGLLIVAASPRLSYLVIGLAACACSVIVAPAMLRGRAAPTRPSVATVPS